jgi:phosphatidylinositol-binding clathrin assembly protein
MSRPDAERALNVYKTFGKQTDLVVQYLSLARQYEASTRLEVPKLKHAPTTLTASLEEYLNDPDFEVNRRQYLAQQEAKRTGKPVASVNKPASSGIQPTKSTATTSVSAAPAAIAQPKAPAPDLIDFFESIEQNPETMGQPQQQQQQMFNTGFMPNQHFQQFQQAPQATGYNPFLQQQQQQQQQPIQQQQQPPQPLQTNFTGAGFGGYGPQPEQNQPYQQPYQFSSLSSIPQNGVADFQQQQQQQPPPPQQMSSPQLQPQHTSTNPFRQSMIPTGATNAVSPMSPVSRQSTNPFAKTNPITSPLSPVQGLNNGPQSQHDQFAQSSTFFQQSAPPPPQQQSPAPLQPQRTGTNPFAKSLSPPPAQPVVANVTGTNPFRQSQFVNQSTGMGWQHSAQGTFGGFDMNQVQTQQIFPRPGANSN